MKIKKGKGIIGGNSYDVALSDPFQFLNGLRGGTAGAAEDFDPDNMNRAAHMVAASGMLDEAEIDIARTIREVVDSKVLVPRDMKIDDSGIPVAKNVYEWCTTDRFAMTNGEKPYIEQLVWGVVAFNEACHRCTDLEYLYVDHKPDDTYRKFERKVALLEHGMCPHCGWGRSKLIKKGKQKFIQELAVCAGQRSGKSLSIAGYFAPYLTHRLLKLQNPNAFYGLKTGTMLHCTFVALTYAQAKDTLWQNYYATLTESAWYREYHGMLKHYEERYGEKLLKFNDTYVAYPSRGLMAYPAGPDKRVLRGRTRFFCLSGDSLVNTGRGLVPMLDDLKGETVICGSKPRNVKGWLRTKYATDMVRVELENGQYLDSTADHRYLTMQSNGKRKWMQAKDLSEQYVAVTLGGVFPEKLTFDFETKPTLRQQYIERMWELGSFTTEQLNATLPKFPGLNALRANLVAEGLLTKIKVGSTAPSVFTAHGHVDQAIDVDGRTVPRIVRDKKIAFEAPKVLTPALATILGYMVADGSYNTDKEFTYTTKSHKKARHMQQCLREVFNVLFEISAYEHYEEEVYRIRIGISEVKSFLRYVGLDKGTSRTKVIPWCILQAPRDCAVAYINAHIVSDGGLRYKCAYIASKSPRVRHQLQQLFLRLGYFSTNTGESVRLSIESTLRFLATDKNHMDKRDDKGFTSGYPLADFNTHSLYSEFKEPYSEAYVRKFPNMPHNAKADPNLIWVKVKSITERPSEWVYDLQVDTQDAAFTANGIVVHNSAIDEIGYFDANRDTKKVKDNAHEVAGALDRSLLTVRGAAERLLSLGYDDVYPGYAMNVSSPSSRNDMIMTLVRRAENSDTMYGIVRPTWEVNPTLPRNSKTIQEAYRTDPLNAERDYGAVPPLAANTFLQNHSEIEDAQTSKSNPIKLIRRVVHSKKRGESYTWAEIKKIKKSKHPSILCLDAGYTNNSFAGAVGRFDGLNVIVDLVFEIQPEVGAPLNHARIYEEVLLPVMEARNVRILLADRWNSIKLLQDAKNDREELEVSEQYSLKYKNIYNMKTMLQQGTLKIPAAERDSFKACIEFDDEHYPFCFDGQPVSHLIMQMATVKDTTKTIDKADGYTDDIFRAVALLQYALQEEDYQAILMAAPDVQQNTRPVALMASKLYSGGGGAIGGGSGQIGNLGLSGSFRR